MIQVALLLVLFALLQAQNNDTSVEVSDMERVKKDDDMTSTAPSKESKEAEERKLQEVKNELDRAVQSLNSTLSPPAGPVTPVSLPNLQSCTALDCNNRGTCLGTRSSYFCACQYGFSGRSCEETICNATTDCNGRGLCIGTSSAVTCFCNLGYGGPHCETAF